MMVARSPSKPRPPRPAIRAIAALTAAAVGLASFPAQPQTGASAGIPMIRDAEIEQLLRDYTAPIFRVAGLADQNIHVVIIDDKSFNAFVMDAHRIFINVGALTQATAPNQVIGVLAHETGHIVGGHLSRLRQELANVQTAALVGLLLGIGAIVAGARSGSADTGNVGMAAITAPQALGMNRLLSYQRAQEESADRAGVNFLNMTGQSAKGMYETFKRFADQGLFASTRADPYLQSHPMPTERLAALAEVARTSPNWEKKDPVELQARHDLMRAKLFGYMERPDTLQRRYPAADTSLAARYARAVST